MLSALTFQFPSKLNVHFSEIGEIAGVAEVTIKQTYRHMLARAPELFPPEFKFVVPIQNLPIA